MGMKVNGRKVLMSGVVLATTGEDVHIDEGCGCTLTIRMDGSADAYPAGHRGSEESDLLLILPAQRTSTDRYRSFFTEPNYEVRYMVEWTSDIEATISYMVLDPAMT